jgi:hypothetical protein
METEWEMNLRRSRQFFMHSDWTLRFFSLLFFSNGITTSLGFLAVSAGIRIAIVMGVSLFFVSVHAITVMLHDELSRTFDDKYIERVDIVIKYFGLLFFSNGVYTALGIAFGPDPTTVLLYIAIACILWVTRMGFMAYEKQVVRVLSAKIAMHAGDEEMRVLTKHPM